MNSEDSTESTSGNWEEQNGGPTIGCCCGGHDFTLPPRTLPPRPPRDDSDDTRAQRELCVVVEHVSAIHARSVHRKSGCRICKRSCRVQRRHPLSRGPAPSPCPSCPSSSPLLPLVLHPFLHSPFLPFLPPCFPSSDTRTARAHMCLTSYGTHCACDLSSFSPVCACLRLRHLARDCACVSFSVCGCGRCACAGDPCWAAGRHAPRLGVRQSGDAPQEDLTGKLGEPPLMLSSFFSWVSVLGRLLVLWLWCVAFSAQHGLWTCECPCWLSREFLAVS